MRSVWSLTAQGWDSISCKYLYKHAEKKLSWRDKENWAERLCVARMSQVGQQDVRGLTQVSTRPQSAMYQQEWDEIRS